MPYSTIPTDPLQPLDSDLALVLGAEMRAVKTYIGAIPQNAQSGNYTCVASDAGKDILHPAADTSGRTWTIPDNATVPFRVGTVLMFSVQHGAGTISLSIAGTDILRLLPSGATGTRTLPANSTLTVKKITATEWQATTVGGS